jgi:hypothetical protein
MTSDIVRAALLTAGASTLIVGPGLQAAEDIDKYHDLLRSLKESDLPGLVRDYPRLAMRLWFPLPRRPRSVWLWLLWPLWLLLLVPFLPFIVIAWFFYFFWPPRLLARYREVKDWSRRYDAALSAFEQEDERAEQLDKLLRTTRNWLIIVIGGLLIFAGSVVDLVSAAMK